MAGTLIALSPRARIASAATAPAADGVSLGQATPLRPLPPASAPFDATARRELAMDALTFFVRQSGLFPGRAIFQLPAPNWMGTSDSPERSYNWNVVVPGGVFLYLLCHVDPSGKLDASAVRISLDGVPVPELGAYVHGGVPALAAGTPRDHAVLDVVIPPPPPGRYRIEVRARPPAAGQVGGAPAVAATPTAPPESVMVYDLTVAAPDSLGPLVLRDAAGTQWATAGPERRRLDAETRRTLGLEGAPSWLADGATLAVLPEGLPLPELRPGLVVRAGGQPGSFLLEGGRRVWLGLTAPAPDAGEPLLVESVVLQTVPPALLPDMLIKGMADDVFHTDPLNANSLRKIPDWKWVTDRGLRPEDLVYVPDRIIASLPQNSPEWRMPGGTFTDRAFDSASLGRRMPYRLFLPTGYDSPERAGQRYPVLYLLHGLSGRYDEWSGYGAEMIANELLRDGQFVDTIMVAPQGGLGYWVDQEGATLWRRYVSQDLVPHIDSSLRTIARREARAIGGLSMGGHGAVQLALNNPDLFGAVGAHSPSIRSRETAPAFFGTGDSYARRDPVSLVRSAQPAVPPLFWIDAGEKDFWRPAAEELRRALTARGWAHEWHIFSGEHDGWYWGDHLWEYLPFYAQAFQKLGVPVTRTTSG